MKTILLILFLFSSTLFAQNEIIIQKTDSDSLWQTVNEVYALEHSDIMIKNVNQYGFFMREGNEEWYCNANTMPKEFWAKIKKRKLKQI